MNAPNDHAFELLQLTRDLYHPCTPERAARIETTARDLLTAVEAGGRLTLAAQTVEALTRFRDTQPRAYCATAARLITTILEIG